MHPINRKVYLILLSVNFSGLIKSRGARVKLMVCQTDSKKKCTKMLGKNFFKPCKTSNFSKKSFFLFKYDKIFKQQSYRIFTQIFELLMFRTVLKNLYNKNFFPSYWPKLWNKLFPLLFFYAKNSNHKHKPRGKCPSLLTVQFQTLNLWEGLFSPQEGMTAPPKLKNHLTGPRLSPIQRAGIRVLFHYRARVSAG